MPVNAPIDLPPVPSSGCYQTDAVRDVAIRLKSINQRARDEAIASAGVEEIKRKSWVWREAEKLANDRIVVLDDRRIGILRHIDSFEHIDEATLYRRGNELFDIHLRTKRRRIPIRKCGNRGCDQPVGRGAAVKVVPLVIELLPEETLLDREVVEYEEWQLDISYETIRDCPHVDPPP